MSNQFPSPHQQHLESASIVTDYSRTAISVSPRLLVTDLHPHDVLFGRGSGPNDHEGNIRFRQYVADRKAIYMATNHRATKTNIAREIVNIVQQQGGRFLKKMEAEVDDSTHSHHSGPGGMEPDVYEIVDDDTIMEKAKQALRQNAAKVRGEQQAVTKLPQSQQTNTNLPTPVTLSGANATVAAIGRGDLDFSRQSNSNQQQQQSYEADLEPLPFTDGYPPQYAQPQRQQEHQQQQEPFIDPIPFPSAYVRLGPLQTVMEPSPIWEEHHQEEDFQQQQPPMVPSRQYSDYQLGTPSSRIGTYPAGLGAHGNNSMAEIPADEDIHDNRRVSLSIADVFKFKEARVIQQGTQSNTGTAPMDDLMDSFNQMKTSETQGDLEQRRMMMSTETMGTIEGVPQGSVADMSIGTMNSSTFSLFGGKGNDSGNMAGWSASGSSGSGSNGQQQQQPKPSFLDIKSDPSLTSSGLTMHSVSSVVPTPSGRSQNMGTAMESSTSLFNDSTLFRSGDFSINGAIDAVRRQVDSEYPSLASLPQPSDLNGDSTNLDRLGDSSMSILRKAFSEDDIGGP